MRGGTHRKRFGRLMDAAAISLLGGLYLISGIAIAASYVPQLARGWRNPEATFLAQSFCSWAVWAACRAIALLYGIFVIGDSLFILAVGLDLLGRLLVLVVILRATRLQRRRSRRRPADAGSPALVADH